MKIFVMNAKQDMFSLRRQGCVINAQEIANNVAKTSSAYNVHLMQLEIQMEIALVVLSDVQLVLTPIHVRYANQTIILWGMDVVLVLKAVVPAHLI